jgi:protein gp37
MADKSKIEWTDATWNPIRGCSVVSEGCRNCYAMAVAARFSQRYWKVWQGMTLISSAKQKLTEAQARNKVANEAAHGVVMEARPSSEGQAYEGLAYRNESGAHWTGQVKLIEEHLEYPLRWKRPRRIFVNSMSDLFHESIPFEWLTRIFHVMARAGHHTFQVLSKRDMSKRIDEALRREVEHLCAMDSLGAGIHQEIIWPLPNVQIIASIEDQPSADQRIPWLMKTDAAVRGISAEPLLGPIDIAFDREFDRLDWVIVGGESGPGARPMHPDWARSLRDQCVAAGVPFFFKQWGEWGSTTVGNIGPDRNLDGDGPEWTAFRKHDHQFVEPGQKVGRATGDYGMYRVGKKAAGRVLDGQTWDEYPAEAVK